MKTGTVVMLAAAGVAVYVLLQAKKKQQQKPAQTSQGPPALPGPVLQPVDVSEVSSDPAYMRSVFDQAAPGLEWELNSLAFSP